MPANEHLVFESSHRRVLNAIRTAEDPPTAAELAMATGIGGRTMLNLLTALVARGAARRDTNSKDSPTVYHVIAMQPQDRLLVAELVATYGAEVVDRVRAEQASEETSP